MKLDINPAEAQLMRVTEDDRQTLWNLLQYMLFETSPSGDNVANADGSFSYEYFDKYFTYADREAYLVKAPDGELIGFVMINQYLQKVDNGHAIAEFLILPRFRRMGIGYEVAKRCFAMYSGMWEVSPANDVAYQFWKKVIDEETEGTNIFEDGLFVFRK